MQRGKAHLERHQRQTLHRITDEKEVLHRLQARNMHSNVQKPNREEKLVLFERPRVKLLTHREEEVTI